MNLEKGSSKHLPGLEAGSDLVEEYPGHVDPQKYGVNERRLMAKVDFRVVPVLCVLYLLAFLDRVNISNAALYGLKEELDIVDGTKYNTVLVIFFVPYILFEIPSNIILKKFKPHMWLSFCMFMFGLMTVIMGFTQNYGGILAVRFFLGLFEAGMFPGCFYLLACWYKRSEAQKRYSFFFSSTTLAGAFGGLLAAAIGNMDGVAGYKAWRWVFILEGLFTVVVGCLFWFCIPDFPEEAKWLTEDERAFIKAKLEADTGESHRHASMTVRSVFKTLADWRIITGGFMYFGLIVPAYGYAYFSPQIVRNLGYSPIETQLRSVPPWACAFGLAMITATASDFIRHRFLFALIPICISLTGFCILFNIHGLKHIMTQYSALFLCAMGTYSAMPIIVCWFACNLGSHARRAVGTGWQVGFGNIGGIIAAFAFLAKEAPAYPTGYKLCISFIVLSAVSCTIYFIGITRENRLRNQGKHELSGLSKEELSSMELGDKHPVFRYMT
ncbi:Sialin [Dactylella cylindrospora]|nr:Sialin [Dactylella cylindrospora]